MRQETFFENNQGLYIRNQRSRKGSNQSTWSGQLDKLGSINLALPRETVIGLILVVALLAFEIFNFDTTQFALKDLLGDVSFIGLGWATILAIAFCAIDFAGLAHLFTPERGIREPKEVWYLTGAWLLGATMNALMTWWAISLTLLNHEFGNEVLSRETLLHVAPVFVAVLVWLTRILFIGAFSVAGEHLFNSAADYPAESLQPATRPVATNRPVMVSQPTAVTPAPKPVAETTTTSRPSQPASRPKTNSRVRQRPPRPGNGRTVPAAMMARGRRG
ncbi:MAG: hypothetical protein WAM60_16045 [Candidatus Promineifilaceae bacterium]